MLGCIGLIKEIGDVLWKMDIQESILWVPHRECTVVVGLGVLRTNQFDISIKLSRKCPSGSVRKIDSYRPPNQ